MDIEFNTEKKARAFVAQIDQLLLSDFPHTASQNALASIKGFFNEHLDRLKKAGASSDKKLLASACTTINQRIFSYLPILGFLLRSTNTRNNFEAYYSFVEIARALIGPDASVIFSSEWDFSPLTYPMTVSVLPKYVLLGMPSSESSNSLILPLAGHELGHSVWANEQLENKFVPVIQAEAIAIVKANWSKFFTAFPEHGSSVPADEEFTKNIFFVFVISDIVKLALSQAEEIFCDGIGVSLFGLSYAFAFHYLLAPSIGGDRSLEYPRVTDRAQFIATFGNLDLTQNGFRDFEAEFIDRPAKLSPRDLFISEMADQIAISFAEEMYKEATTVVQLKANLYASDPSAQTNILNRFEKGLPARDPRSLPDIVNAGWAFLNAKAPTFVEDDRALIEWISELVLKSIEVLEFKSRMKDA